MITNRRRWIANGIAAVSAGTGLPSRLLSQAQAVAKLPARSHFPVTEKTTYLNNAALHPFSAGVVDALQTYSQLKASGSSHFSDAPFADEVKAQFATLIHAPASSISFVPSTVAGENLVASGIVPGLGLTPTDGNIVTDALHYQGSTYLYRSLQARAVDVRFVKPREYRIDLADLEKSIDRHTKLVSISLVSYLNGFRHDLKAVCDLAHSYGAHVYADLVQAAGAIPVDVHASGVDFCACGGHKWLMGDMGLGFLYVREDLLDRVVRGTQFGSRQITRFENHVFPYDVTPDAAATWKPNHGTAAHFEIGTISQSALAALSYSLPYLQRLGVENIQAHSAGLTARLQKELPRLGYPSVTPPETGSHIVSFVVKDPRTVAAKLKKANVEVKIDQHLLRISPSVYNDQTDIDRLLEALS